MDKYLDPSLDHTFSALSDATRRAIVARLSSEGRLSVSALAQPFSMSLPALMKHLDVLERAGMIARAKSGRTVSCWLSPAPMESAMDWLNRYQQFWSLNLDNLATFLEDAPCPQNQASPSTAGSTPRARKSTPRGRTRRS